MTIIAYSEARDLGMQRFDEDYYNGRLTGELLSKLARTPHENRNFNELQSITGTSATDWPTNLKGDEDKFAWGYFSLAASSYPSILARRRVVGDLVEFGKLGKAEEFMRSMVLLRVVYEKQPEDRAKLVGLLHERTSEIRAKWKDEIQDLPKESQHAFVREYLHQVCEIAKEYGLR